MVGVRGRTCCANFPLLEEAVNGSAISYYTQYIFELGPVKGQIVGSKVDCDASIFKVRKDLPT